MSSRKKSRDAPPMEQDSFLDIVANLVGILIILVVVFGAQIGETITNKDSPETEAALATIEQQRRELVDHQQVLQQRDAEYVDWQAVIDQQEVLIQQRRMERHLAMQQLAVIENEVREKVATLSQTQQTEIRLRQTMTQQAREIQQLSQALETVQLASLHEEYEPKIEII
ncbi:MAG: hypothetical protein Q8M16_23850, partial [Pirellulaceae bacterium]|nr:hypothetical protein [Pirellulaceae bacterium]